MPEDRLDISTFLDVEEGLPRPQWDRIAGWVTSNAPPEQHHAVWTDIARQWLTEVGRALWPGYQVASSQHFWMLAPSHLAVADWLGCAEDQRKTLLDSLPGVAAFRAPGKLVLIVFDKWSSYHQYWSCYDQLNQPETSANPLVHNTYLHAGFCWRQPLSLQSIRAHELTKYAICHLSQPQWLRTGLVNTFEYKLSARETFPLTEATAREHRRFWSYHGLKPFWTGEGFPQIGGAPILYTELATILLRLLSLDHRPRWFGLDRRPQQRFFAFLKEAQASDCGEGAARAHLGYGLGDLTSQFLGPGDWSPPPAG